MKQAQNDLAPAPYELLPKGTGECPFGTGIQSMDACKEATRSLGLSEEYKEGDYNYIPAGCVRIEPLGADRRRMTRWNEAVTGRGNGDAQPICTKATHYKAVVSWPSAAWGVYPVASNGAQSVCLPKDATTNGQGTLFVSCCSSAGAGLSRDCSQKQKTHEEAVAFCMSSGNRLCTETEVLKE